MSDAPNDPLIGTVLAGRYRIVRLLGRGGMGSVYAAEQAPLKREVALKLLRKDLATEAVAVERFKREAQIIAALGHPHVVALHDFGADEDGSLFIAMELLPGEDLYSRIKRKGPMPWPRVLRIAEQTARALAGAHARGVIHRDLKPANILLLNTDGVRDFVKVLDFGVAKLVREKRARRELTGEEIVPGTVGFIAPEIIEGKSDSDDPRADLYSLGATMFQTLTARAPFLGDSMVELIMRQMSDDVAPPSSIVDGIPREIDELVLRLLAKSPAARPQTASEVADALAKLDQDLRLRGETLLATLPDDGPVSGPSLPIVPATLTALPRTPHTVARPSKLRVPAAVAVAVFVVVAAAAVLFAAREVSPRAQAAAHGTGGQESASQDPIYFPSPPAPRTDASRGHAVDAGDDVAPVPATTPDARAKRPTPARAATTPSARETTTSAATTSAMDAGPVTSDAAGKRDPDEPDDSDGAVVDEAWRARAREVLDGCAESCAKVVGPRLGALDLAKVTRTIKGAVDECVSKCDRKKR